MVEKRNLETAKDNKEINTVHGNGEECSSLFIGTGCIHEIHDPTKRVAQWIIENEKHMVADKSYHRSSSAPSILGEGDGDEDIGSRVLVHSAIGIVEDVAEETGADTASNKPATVQGIMNEVVIESLENGIPSLTDEVLWFPSFRGSIGKAIDDFRKSFNWNDFLYTLTFGFLPTAWDVYTDINLGIKLQNQGDVHTAGLCWMFVCLPPGFLTIEILTKKNHSTCLQLLLLGLGFCYTATFAYLVNFYPQVFFYPALCLCLILCGGKFLAVFIHTPEMKQFSVHLSHVECSFEASCQLVLILAIWLSGGEMHLTCMISSVVVIGKVSAENFLMANPKNLLEKASFCQRIMFTIRFIPVFALTAFFRCGAGIVNVLNYNNFTPFSPSYTIFLMYCYIVVYYFLFMILGYMLKLVMWDMRQLTAVELSYSLVGECSTITMWGKLGRKGSRLLQFIMNTYYFVSRY